MVRIPEYSETISSDAGEIVMSRPAWYRKHGKPTTLLVDAHAWPPAIVKLPLRVAAAARLPSKQWVLLAKPKDAPWQVRWYADIRAAEPLRIAEPPFTVEADQEDADDGPFRWLRAFGDAVIGVPPGGADHRPHAFALRDEAWREEPALANRAEYFRVAQARHAGGARVLEWHDALFDDALAPVDARGCTWFVDVADRAFALHQAQLVEITETELVPRLPGHALTVIQAGPPGTLIVTLVRDDERGSSYEYGLYDVTRDAIAILPKPLVGDFPKVVAVTDAGDLVLHDDNKHALKRVTAKQLGALKRIAASAFEAPKPQLLPIFDGTASASRPTVAVTGNAIAMSVDRALRFHTIDSPHGVVHLDGPIIGIAAHDGRIAALDSGGILHVYESDGELASRPTGTQPRSLAVDRDGNWIAVDGHAVHVVDDRRSRAQRLEIEAAVAVAPDPDGGLVIACEGHRLLHWRDGETRDLPPTREQILAVAPLGDGRFACAGQQALYLLDLAQPELTSLDRRLRRPHLATHVATGRIAYCDSAGAVEIERFADGKLVDCLRGGVRYSSYSSPADTDVTVRGLAFADDGRLVIQLDDGRGNIVDPATAATLKLDEQEGDSIGRWVFICGGQILMAG